MSRRVPDYFLVSFDLDVYIFITAPYFCSHVSLLLLLMNPVLITSVFYSDQCQRIILTYILPTVYHDHYRETRQATIAILSSPSPPHPTLCPQTQEFSRSLLFPSHNRTRNMLRRIPLALMSCRVGSVLSRPSTSITLVVLV